MLNIGIIQRDTPPLQVLRGYDPQRPSTLAVTLSVDTNRGAELIASGQLISANEDGSAWRLGVDKAKPSDLIAWAVYDSWDVPTLACDALVGLTSHGQFRLGTPFFARTTGTTGTVGGTPTAKGTVITYKPGTLLTYCGEDEVDVATTAYVDDNGVLQYKPVVRSLKGYVRPATTGETVIGMVTEKHTGINGAAYVDADTMTALRAKALIPEGVWALQGSVGTAVDSTSIADNAYMLVFDTHFEK